jgi:hypothetical protein
MIQITRGQANTVYVTVTELMTLTNPYILFKFTKESTNEINTVLVTNSSSYTRRYDKFVITESDTEDRLNGTLTLNGGEWHYEIYELSSASLTPSGTPIEDGSCKVTDNSLGNTYIENREANVYIE